MLGYIRNNHIHNTYIKIQMGQDQGMRNGEAQARSGQYDQTNTPPTSTTHPRPSRT